MAHKRARSYLVRDPAQLEAVVAPVRHQMLRTLSAIGPATVAELAAQLERSPESLYYHVRALQDVGLIVEVDDDEEGLRPARIDTVARRLLTDPQQSSARYVEAMKRSAASLLRLANRQLQDTLDRQQAEAGTRPPTYRSQQFHARLRPAAVRELNALLDQVGRFMTENDDPEGSMVAVTLASAPVRPRTRGERE